MQANTYLYFAGNCKEAFEFYEIAVGGKINAMMPHTGTPAEEHTPAEWRDKIIHANMTIGTTLLMASDAPPGRQHPQSGFSVSLNVDTPAEAERIYAALSEGGTVQMPLEETFFAHRFAMFDDKFGIPWMVVCAKAM
jgi:PhnB protein